MKRKQILLPDKMLEDIEQVAKEEERSFSGIVRGALWLWYFMCQRRKEGWTFYREKDGERIEINWI